MQKLNNGKYFQKSILPRKKDHSLCPQTFSSTIPHIYLLTTKKSLHSRIVYTYFRLNKPNEKKKNPIKLRSTINNKIDDESKIYASSILYSIQSSSNEISLGHDFINNLFIHTCGEYSVL